MGFVSTLSDDEFHASAFKRDNDHLIIVPLGYDDGDDEDEERSYSLFVTLGPQAGGALELTFSIVVEDGDGKHVDTIWNGWRANRLFDTVTRRSILKHLLFSIRQLLLSVNPDAVFMCTMDLGPREQGLRKYVRIARVFEMCGYRVGRFDRYEGQCVWLMERQDALGVDTIGHDVSAETQEGVCHDEPRSAD